MVIFLKNEGIQTFLSIQLFPQVYALAPRGGYARVPRTHQVIIIGRGDPMLTRDFELRISWISWGFRNHLANPMGFVV